jgi:hypothetical protein
MEETSNIPRAAQIGSKWLPVFDKGTVNCRAKYVRPGLIQPFLLRALLDWDGGLLAVNYSIAHVQHCRNPSSLWRMANTRRRWMPGGRTVVSAARPQRVERKSPQARSEPSHLPAPTRPRSGRWEDPRKWSQTRSSGAVDGAIDTFYRGEDVPRPKG